MKNIDKERLTLWANIAQIVSVVIAVIALIAVPIPSPRTLPGFLLLTGIYLIIASFFIILFLNKTFLSQRPAAPCVILIFVLMGLFMVLTSTCIYLTLPVDKLPIFGPPPTPTQTPTITTTPTPSQTPSTPVPTITTLTPEASPTTISGIFCAEGTEVELLVFPWEIRGDYNSAEESPYQELEQNILLGKDLIKVELDLHGTRFEYSPYHDGSSIIFVQDQMWKLADILEHRNEDGLGTNGVFGKQTIFIPLSDFVSVDNNENTYLDPNVPVDYVHARFYSSEPFVVDIYSIVACKSKEEEK